MRKHFIVNKSKRNIIIVCPNLNRLGGGTSVCTWTIEALKNSYQIILITFSKVDINKLNKFTGANLKSNEFLIVRIPLPWVFRRIKGLDLIKKHIFYRLLRQRINSLNFPKTLLISIGDEVDINFGSTVIQYVCWPALNKKFYKFQDSQIGKWYRSKIFRNFYLGICKWISKFSEEKMKQNVTITNSEWTKKQIYKAYKINSLVTYSPIKFDVSQIPWKEKENGFLCIGTITPEKEIEKIISILGKVRPKNNIHLHIIGRIQDTSYYRNKISPLIKRNREWIFEEINIPRIRLNDLIAEHKYGIHGMQNEHFGRVIAEMIGGGCIVFVPRGGGQQEIVNYNKNLIYNDKQDAVEKIHKVLNNSELQMKLAEELNVGKNRFSYESFCKKIKNLVSKYV